LFLKALSSANFHLKTLARKIPASAGGVEVLPLSQSTVSQHLKELKNAGLIKGEIDGQASCYFIDWDNLLKTFESLEKLINYLKEKGKSYNCCS
jgi:DNA-binding transcriptional ArsR family regulator